MIFAAGLGIRLRPLTNDRPKALVEVNGKTLLQRNVEYLYSYGIRDIVINIHHFPVLMRDAITAMDYEGLQIRISDESEAVLETGGGLLMASHFFHTSPILVMNVDILTDLDINDMVTYHNSRKALATLAISDRKSSRGFLFDQDLRLCGWRNLETIETRMSMDVHDDHITMLSFSGLQIIDHALLEMIPFHGKFSIIEVYLSLARKYLVAGYSQNDCKWVDVGRPESLSVAESLFN